MPQAKQVQDFKERLKASESLTCTNCTKPLVKKPLLPGLCHTCAAAKLRHMADRCEEREPLPQNLTDLGNMERLVARHGQDFRYSKASGWIRWSGKSWEIDATGKINEAAYDTARMIRAEIRTYSKDDENLAEIKKAIIAWSKASEARARLDAMVALAQSDSTIACRLEDFDRNPNLFNCSNGTLDLRNGDFRPHDRNDLLTNISAVTYDATARCPRWDRFILEIMGGDQQMADFLQRAVGYTLTGLTTEQCLFILWGTGSNGKSTFIETIRYVLGSYSQTADFQTFMAKRFGPQGGPSSDIAKLRGARMVSATEAEEGQRLAESLIKQITGGDTISACFKFKEHFEFRPQLKLWLLTNHKPQIVGTDEGIWRRIRLIPFNRKFEKDDKLAELLISEAPGILRWAVEGVAQWRKHGLMEPQIVKDATTGYRADEDIIMRFIQSECEVGKGFQTPSRKLYDTFKRWAQDNHEVEMSERKFAESMKEHGYSKDRKPSGIFYFGLQRIGQIEEKTMAAVADSDQL
jgi:putative DNA primase/helicase